MCEPATLRRIDADRRTVQRAGPVRRLAAVSPRTDLPTGTVTFLFTDIEGSTRLVQRLGDDAAWAFDQHADLIRGAVREHRGIEVGTEGDSFFCVFASAPDALDGAVAAQRALYEASWPDEEPVRVRMGLHTGIGALGGDDYFGLDVHRAARVGASGHGGQIVISASTNSVVERALPPDVEIRDLGLFRLKDLAEPEHLHDVVVEGLPSSFPPLATVVTPERDLPEPLSSFIGRSSQVDHVVGLFADSRLVTCTGPGGVGKTRLAVQIASKLTDRFDAAHFVPLAPIGEPELVAPTILRTLGVPPTGEDAKARLPVFLADKRWLLLLDNFEQVVEAAPVVASILRSAPRVAILVTSRTALRVAGETEFAVPPLALADPMADVRLDVPEDAEAVRLFVDRARAVRPNLVVDADALGAIADITSALDGLPLAIELAAARIRVMTPSDLRYRMSGALDLLATSSLDVDERQRTLRNTIAWSYDLLDDRQRRLLEDLSVFSGGATLDAIEATSGLGRNAWEWLDDLDALVGHSLVARVETSQTSRFQLLETIREFAAERLDARDDAPGVFTRHVEWSLQLAEHAAAGLTTIDQGTWLDALDREQDNLRSALALSIQRGRSDWAAALVSALWRYWHMRGPIPEGIERAGAVLSMDGLGVDDRIRTLEAAGGLEWWAGNVAGASAHYLDALELTRASGSEAQLANALYNTGLAIGFSSPGDGTDYLSEGLALAELTGDVHAAARCRWALCSTYQFEHEFELAHTEFSKALSGFEQVGDAFMTNWTLRDLGSVEMVLGRLADAEAHLSEAIGFFSRAGDLSGTLLLLRDHARMAALGGDMDRALRLIGAADKHEQESGLNLGQFELEALGIENPLVISDPDAADRLRAEGRSWTIDDAVAYARGDDSPPR